MVNLGSCPGIKFSTPEITSCYYNVATWLTFNLVDCTAGRQMSLLRFLKKPGGDESSPLLPTPQSSAENRICKVMVKLLF